MLSRKLRVGILALAIAAAATAGVVAVSGADDGAAGDGGAKRGGFKPKDIAGKWTGDWKNTTFGSQGDILANVKVNGKKFIPIVDFSGNVLGCADPPEDSVTLKKGNGNNKWNSAGFKVDTSTKAFGDLSLVYHDSNHKITATGNSPCQPSTTFKMSGKLKSSSFSANVDIDFGGGQGATAKLSAKKD